MLLLFLLQPAEKQLAATTTDLTSNNPMRLLPIIGVLIAIVLLLVIFAVIIVIAMRSRNNGNSASAAAAAAVAAHRNNSRHGSMTSGTSDVEIKYAGKSMSTTTTLDNDPPASPDVIPNKPIVTTGGNHPNNYLYDRMNVMTIRESPPGVNDNNIICFDEEANRLLKSSTTTSAHSRNILRNHNNRKVFFIYFIRQSNLLSINIFFLSFFLQPSECQYAELAFSGNYRNNGGNSEEHRHLLNNSDNTQSIPTTVVYAKINHENQQKTRQHLVHSHNCPLKVIINNINNHDKAAYFND